MEKLRLNGYSTLGHKLAAAGWILVFLLIVSPMTALSQTGKELTVSGIVTDESGAPIIGASVVVANTTVGVSTGLDGSYSLSVPAGAENLVFSYIGYISQTLAVANRTQINVVLAEETQTIDQVIVVGYGVQKKESSVAAISQVKGDELLKTTATSIANALAGQIPGVSTVQASGEPGRDHTKVMIRGVSSWVSSDPLVLVDGVERDYNNIDPAEIETMSVLKDASATAVFGVRGANGVILITTKRGKAGEVKVNFSTEFGLKQPIGMVHAMDSYRTGLVMNEARKNDNAWGSMLSDEVLEHYRIQDMPYVYTNTDWQDVMLKNGFNHKYNLNVSGGTDFARVFASLSYLHDGDIIRTERNLDYDPAYKYDRYNYRFNVDMNLTKTTLLAIDAGGYIGIKNHPNEYQNIRRFRPILCLGPMDGVPYYPAEILEQYPDEAHPDETGRRIGTTDLTNSESPVVANSYSGSRSVKTSNVNLSLRLQQDLSFITKGLSAKVQGSYNNTTRWEKVISYDAITYKLKPDGTWIRRSGRDDAGREEPGEIPNVATEVLDGDGGTDVPRKNYYLEASINYERTFGDHAVTAMWVGQRRKTMRNVMFPSYEQGMAMRVTYAYANKYLFEANLGYNGSEQFAPDKQYGFFPSFAVGYNLHNEKFFQPLRKVFNRAKIRASYGEVGSDASGGDRWLFTSSYVSGSAWNYQPGLPNAVGPNRTSIIEEAAANINATWEVATKRDIGFELAFMKNEMFVLTMDFYDEKREGILLSRNSVPAWAGIQPKKMNLGSTKTKGYEIELKFQYATPDNDWYVWVKPAVSFSDNRITNRDEPLYSPAYQKQAGHRIGQLFGYHHSGWIQDADVAMTSARYGGGLMGLGDTEYVDFNGDGIIDDNDRYAMGYSQNYPLYNYSLSAGFRFRNFEFDFLLQAVSHFSKHVIDSFAWPLHRLSNQVFDYQLDAWSPDNRDARYPAFHFDSNRGHNNITDGAVRSVSVYNASYIRLKNINIAYNLPKRVAGKLGLSSAKVYLRGNNLFTWAPDYPLGDPEASDDGGNVTYGYYPMVRTFTVGLQFGF